MADYSRPASGFRFRFDGINVNNPADALPEFKYPYAANIRGFQDNSIQSRPPLLQVIAQPSGVGNNPGPVLSFEPTVGLYRIGTNLLFNTALIDTGYFSGLGCSFIPWRPSASPNTYDYLFDNNKSTKTTISSGTPVVQKVGIAEPQSAPDAVPTTLVFAEVTTSAGAWTASGTAGSPTAATRSTETVGVALADPIPAPFTGRFSVQVGSTQNYSQWQRVNITGTQTFDTVIVDVIPPINNGGNLKVQSIFYFSGTTGHCIVVPVTGQAHGGGFHGFGGVGKGGGEPVFSPTDTTIAGLRRGALVQIDSEIVIVWSVNLGPDGSISFETSTVSNHVAGANLVGIPTIVVGGGASGIAGETLTSSNLSTAVTTGIGFITTSFGIAVSPFNIQMAVVNSQTGNTVGNLPQADDYIHFSMLIDNLANLIEIKVLFDVGDGSFTQNFYYKTVRPSDIQTAVANQATQLGAVQVAAQRATTDEELAQIAAAGNQYDVSTSLQTSAGSSQWTEIVFKISDLTRIGNAQNLSLNNCVKAQLLINCSGTVNFGLGGFYVAGGGAIDTDDTASPVFYRVQPRSSITGARGNPSPATRYGVFARRQSNLILFPVATYDSQIDTWDVFRSGSTVDDYRYVGSTSVNNPTFIDNITDAAIISANLLEENLFEPWPAVGPPITALSATIIGTTMVVTFPRATASPAAIAAQGTLSQIGNLLPGNEINVGQAVYTLRVRPTFISQGGSSQTWLFIFEENAGTQTNPIVNIFEPSLANQQTNNVFGPDVNGKIFSVGAGLVPNGGLLGLRAGLVQWSNANDPDSADDGNTSDIVPPTEPLINGAIVLGYPLVFSSKRAWRGYAQNDGTYQFNGFPCSGLASELAICSDGCYVYYLTETGICKTDGGAEQSLTDADLYVLFPHEGIFQKNIVYAGNTIFAPEYQYAANFRLNVINNFLYFDYMDGTQTQRSLVCDLRKNAWSIDVYSPAITIHAGTTQPASNGQIPVSAVKNQILFMADINGAIYREQSPAELIANTGEQVNCVITTREEMVGDIRANKLFGDAAIDALASGGNMTVTPIFFGNPFGTSTTITGGQATRPLSPPTINLSGEQIQRSMGLNISWTDQGTTSLLHIWQISYLTQPEDITNRITDWDSAGATAAKFFQGFIIEADTINQPKSFSIRGGDDLLIKQTFSIQHNGQQQKAYTFTTPFIAHLVRIEPDSAVWRMFGVKWIFEPTPEFALNWITQATSHSIEGYQHVPFVNFAYNAPQPVTLVIAVDGIPVSVTLPATNGYQKVPVRIPPNKGLVFQYSATSSQPFQVWQNDIEILVGQWGRSTPYQTVKLIGSMMGAQASI